MHPPVIFSIVSANYLAYARTLMQSVREHHPDSLRYVFLADEDPGNLDLDPDEFTVVTARELGIPHFDHFAMRYSILEFNTALKPAAFRWLASKHVLTAIIYLDPDILVLGPLDDVAEAVQSGALVVITPHLTAPVDDGKRPDEVTMLRVGAYNLGFVAVGPHPERNAFIEWWARRLEFNAVIDLESGLFTDQKWIDLVPGMFPDVRILRRPGYNLAYWNLAHRTLTSDGQGRLLANGELVRFVHFSGVDFRYPSAFSVHQDRYDAATIGALDPHYRHYLQLLRDNGYDRYSRVPYGFRRLRDGTTITQEMRAIFRNRFDIGAPETCADPFEIRGSAFDDDASIWMRIARLGLRQHSRLKGARLVRMTMNRLSPRTRWALRGLFVRTATPRSLRAARVTASTLPLGIPTSRPTALEAPLQANVIGYFKGEFGVAETARSLVRAARARDIEIAPVNVDARSTARELDMRLADEFVRSSGHPISIFCVNADQIETVMSLVDTGLVAERYVIGYWAWELPHFPPAWHSAVDLVDEIWVPSSFVASSLASATKKVIRVVPVPVDAEPSRRYLRAEFELPTDRFVFLFSFDFRSFASRKNPEAVIEAFRKAFPGGKESVLLVIKTTNGAAMPRRLDDLIRSVSHDHRIVVQDGFMTRDEMFGLESVVDSYVSLHRSEGYGLGLAESMSLGKPVIATGWSGNMEFMDASTSLLVGYRPVPVKQGEYPHAEGQVWADPDIDQAAYFMRRLVDDRELRAGLGHRAKEHMANSFSYIAIGQRVQSELARITRTRV
jgi:glycosyltransferase involved in cell wall biosynthesis